MWSIVRGKKPLPRLHRIFFFFWKGRQNWGLPSWLRKWIMHLQWGKPGFDHWVKKISWRRAWKPTPVFLPGHFHGQRSVAGYCPRSLKESDTTEQVTLSLSITIKGFSVVNEAEVDSKGMLKILQARLQQDMKQELPDVHAEFRKCWGARDQIANICWIIGKCKKNPERYLLLLYWRCQSLLLCESQQTVENSQRDGNTRPHYLPPEKPVCRSRSNT